MVLSAAGLRSLLQKNIVEGVFPRRNIKEGWRPTRRIFCTLDRNLLQSLAGRLTFNFTPPTHPPPYHAQSYNLCVVYDLFWQDWRAIPLDNLQIVSVIPTHTKKQQDEFWKYFSEFLQQLTPQQKERFMNT
jgi:hypothetical protein